MITATCTVRMSGVCLDARTVAVGTLTRRQDVLIHPRQETFDPEMTDVELTGTDEERVALESVVASRAAQYLGLPAGASASSELTSVDLRLASRLYRFLVGSQHVSQRIIVKVPLARPMTHEGGRPLLAPRTPAVLKASLEFRALTVIDRSLTERADPRIAAVRPLDFLPERSALVMEDAGEPDLRRVIRAAVLSRPGSANRARLLRGFHNAGLWLRALHAMPFEHAEARRSTIAELMIDVDASLDYLRSRVDRRIVDAVAVGMLRALSAMREPTLAACHGDFAMRNVLVDGLGRVRAIDVLGRWRTPIFEDVAYFLNGMRVHRFDTFLTRRASERMVAGWEAAFLDGYFGVEEVPAADLRAYRGFLYLDRWTAMVDRRAKAPRRRLPRPAFADARMGRLVLSMLQG